MTFLADVEALRHRIHRAEAERDAWRISGRQENYLEACSMVDALGVQLEALERSARDDAAQRRAAVPAAAPGEAARTPAELMARLHIDFNGRSYHYRGYRYDRLADAANYAELDGSRPSCDLESGGAPVRQIAEPSDVERELMRRHAISFEDGVFRWRGYRYDRLDDALAYAGLAPPA